MIDTQLIKKIVSYHAPLFLKGNLAAHNSIFLSQIKPVPKGVEFHLTDNCCLKCIMCNAWRKKSVDELTFEEIIGIIDQLKLSGFASIAFTGGEVLLRKNLIEIIKYAHKLDFKILLYTNGYLINEEIAEELVENGVSSISISLDGIGEKYEQIRGVKGSFSRVSNAIEIFSLLAKRKKLHSFSLSTNLIKQNIDNIPEILNFVINKEIPISFNLPEFTSYLFQNLPLQKDLWIEENDMYIVDELVNTLREIKKKHPGIITENFISLDYIRNYFRDPIRKDVPCFYLLKNIIIDSHGMVYPCAAVSPIGNLRKENLSSIIESDDYIKRAQKLFKKDCPGCSCSYNINLRYNIPSLIKEMQLKTFDLIENFKNKSNI